MTSTERKHVQAIIKYEKDPPEIAYDEWAYKRMQNAYRTWLKNLLKYKHPEPKKRKS